MVIVVEGMGDVVPAIPEQKTHFEMKLQIFYELVHE